MCNCNGACKCGGWNVAVGRVLLGLLFVVAGFGKLMGFAGAEQMVAFGFSSVPSLVPLLTVGAIIIELGVGLMLVLGFHARLAAWILIIFTVVVTALYHQPVDMLNQIMMLKNISIIGGLLYVTAYGAGMWSLAKWNSKCCMGGKMCPDCKAENKEGMNTPSIPTVK